MIPGLQSMESLGLRIFAAVLISAQNDRQALRAF
jgi:hypothetical protein